MSLIVIKLNVNKIRNITHRLGYQMTDLAKILLLELVLL